MVVGPRASGKTTTASRLARTIIRLDRPGDAGAFAADPDAALRGLDEPVLLDEWQAVPGVLAAVKRAVDAEGHAGRYILTGSVRADLEAETWPGTGRVVRVPMYPLSVAERLERRTTPLIDRLARGETLGVLRDPPDLRGYVELALAGGFPETLALTPATRLRWLDSYVDQLITADALQVDGGRDPTRLRRFFEALALNTAGTVDVQTLLATAGINRKTAVAYEQLLTNLMVVDVVPAWTSNRLKRLIRSPKRHVVEPALIAGVLRLDVASVMRDGDLLGRILDTFVAAQIRSELAVAESRPRLYHLRQEQGRHEIDLLVELGAGRVLGIEIKADAAPAAGAAKHLVWLRDELGERFVGGVVLHTGPRVYGLGERIVAAPICTLWS